MTATSPPPVCATCGQPEWEHDLNRIPWFKHHPFVPSLPTESATTPPDSDDEDEESAYVSDQIRASRAPLGEPPSEPDVLIANLITTAREAGFRRGRGLSDEDANKAEDDAVSALRSSRSALVEELRQAKQKLADAELTARYESDVAGQADAARRALTEEVRRLREQHNMLRVAVGRAIARVREHAPLHVFEEAVGLRPDDPSYTDAGFAFSELRKEARITFVVEGGDVNGYTLDPETP